MYLPSRSSAESAVQFGGGGVERCHGLQVGLAGLDEFQEVEIVADGILLRPQKVIDATQAWFWTRGWQAGEREAAADIAAGRTETFETEEDFLASFDE